MNMFLLLLLVTYIVAMVNSLFAYNVPYNIKQQFLDTDKPLNFTAHARIYGQRAVEYEVQTEDGYLLGLHRIPGRRGLPILLMHGYTDTSDTWIVRGYKSLGITLASLNYDVWFGNIRGNRYSRRHVKLNPDKDASFWDYSFHEYGHYDLPAIIDTILSKTGSAKLNAIGHSQGNTIFYVLGSTRPEYNKKINVLTALAPICYLNNLPPPLSKIELYGYEIIGALMKLGVNEIFGDVSPSGRAAKAICERPEVGYAICVLGAIFSVSGYDAEEFPPYIFDVVIKHYPAATSRKNFNHFWQVAVRERFSKFDYGPEKNYVEYNSTIPPDYNLKAVTMPVVLIAAKNDKVSLISNVEILNQQLPNVVAYKIIERDLTNHVDFVWGSNMYEYLFPYIFAILRNFQ
ncbi:lipase 1-like [Bicyclus anynana]|uniref:Lipase n=1 Tax=Bicyclus anynana TaxID=110368 RepID=A0A6J1MV60_BICAN|nr:lipase 1-like [Bicyclus anynana]